MKWLDLRGRERAVSVADYMIDWDGESLSRFQFQVKQWLKPRWSHHLVLEEAPVVGTRMSIDIINVSLNVAIEVQGAQHTSFNAFMHNGSVGAYKDQIKRDLQKARWCEVNGFTLVEILPTDLAILSTDWFLTRYQLHI